VQLDPLTNVERGHPGIADQVRGSGHSKQTETQFFKLRIFSAMVVEFSNPSEKLVGREWQATHGVYLIYEDYNPARISRQDYLSNGLQASLERAQDLVMVPEFFELVFHTELLSHLREQSAVPLLGCDIHPDCSQVEDCDPEAFIAQAGGGADHERGFAHLPRGEHVGELAVAHAFIKLFVSLASYVAARVAG
jgi:hypothetical protein